MTEPSPESLLGLVRAGDARAWDALVRRYTGFVWAVARSLRLGDADAADVVQVTWLRLLENLHRINDPGRIQAWLATTARREALHTIRRRNRETLVEPTQVPEPREPSAPPEAAVLGRDRDRHVRQAVFRLSSFCQQLLRVLIADPPPSYRAVGEALDIPIGSIGPRRRRCLDNLRTMLGTDREPDDVGA